MNALIICPADRPAMAFLDRPQPLALLPILGRPLLDLWITELAAQGAKSIRILAADRPDQIRRYVRQGEAWGIPVEVIPEQRELSPDEALARHVDTSVGTATPTRIVTLDRLPPNGPELWNSIAAWFAAVCDQFAAAATDRIGMRQLNPGVYVHVRSRISPGAILKPPCWIGADSWIGPRATIGPNTIIEAHSYVDDGAEIAESLIGPGTYVGALTEVRDSLAWKRDLYKIPTGSSTRISDGFLLGPVHASLHGGQAASLLARLAALLVIALTFPVLAIAWLRRSAGQPLFLTAAAVRTPTSEPTHDATLVYHQLNGFRGFLRRWPELWMIVLGHFCWVGNRPLSPIQADALTTEYERLWLGVPTGLISLADAEGCDDPFGDEARAHSSFFAISPGWRHRAGILWRALTRSTPAKASLPPSPSTP
jgi:hypothetical protein